MNALLLPATRERLTRELARPDGAVVIEAVQPAAELFEYDPATGAEVCIAAADGGAAAVVLVSADLVYVGADASVARRFAEPPLDNGWRLVGWIEPADAAAAAEFASSLLGLADGSRPGPPPPAAVLRVPAAEIGGTAEGQGADPRLGEDLVRLARERGRGSNVIGRDAEVETLVRVLSKLTKNAAALVGPPGVGKTAVVEAFAARVAAGKVPEALADARIFEINLSFLAAGASYRNEFEGRVKSIVDGARDDPRTILFIDEVHTLCAPGTDVSQMLKADLGRGRLRCIGATTPAEWRRIEADHALARRFQVIPVREPTPAETVEILRRLLPAVAAHHRVTVPDALLPEVVDLAIRFMPDRHLPDKAIDLLDEAAAHQALRASHGAGLPSPQPETMPEAP